MTRSQYAEFFEGIARQHAQIRHLDGDRVAFAVWDDPSESLNEAPFALTWQEDYVMVLEGYELSVRANRSGGLVSSYPGGFFIVAVPNSGERASRLIHTEAEWIARQIWAKVLHDQREAGGWTAIGGELHKFDQFQGLRCYPVFGFDGGATGIRAEFQLTQESSVCDEYQPGQWLSN